MADVYFTDFRTTVSENILQKLRRLLTRAGMGKIDFKDKFAAIKMHFGEPGNLAFLRPNYAKVVADFVRERGGRPFLTDSNTLYVGGRKNALDHLDAAFQNGFTPYAAGCHVIIADGIKGLDDVEVPLPDGKYVKAAKIGRAIMDADVFISLTHFKGHELTGIGGTLKNIGMGSGSRRGKMEMHSAGKPSVAEELCVGCGLCAKNCAHGAISLATGKAVIDHAKCVGCGRCIGVCPKNAPQPQYDEANAILDAKMAEYAAAVVRGRPSFHVSIICDVSPNCDCHSENDAPVIPNIGMLASADPLALDQACTDLCNAAPVLPNSLLAGLRPAKGADYFDAIHTVTHWRDIIPEAERLGLGSHVYRLVKI